MSFSEIFIRRPIATSLLMAAIALFGVVSYQGLPISDLPAVEYPTINVNANLPGGDPVTICNKKHDKFHSQDSAQDRRSCPDPRGHELRFLLGMLSSQVQHHDHENEEDHDRTGIDNDLERCNKWCSKNEKDHGNRQERHDQVQERMDGVRSGDDQERSRNGNEGRYVK